MGSLWSRIDLPLVRSWLGVAALGAVLTVLASSCTPSPAPTTPTAPPGGTSVSSADPNRPYEPIPDLPTDPTAARDELRRRMAGEWEFLLTRSELRYQSANFMTIHHTDGSGWWSADLIVSFGDVPQLDWARMDSVMANAARASGWGQAGVSHGLSVRKGSFSLKGGCGLDGCSYTLSTGPRLTQELAMVPGVYSHRVEELESHLDPAAPPPTRG